MRTDGRRGRRLGLTACVGCMAGILMGLVAGVQAATWQGGTNDWASDNWGLDAPDGYPGDAYYTNTAASLNGVAGQARIKAGDAITNKGSTFATTVTIRQTGGAWVANSTVDIRSRLDLLGGVLTGAGAFKMGVGAVWNIDGGELGTRLSGPPGVPVGATVADTVLSFEALGGTLLVTQSGIVDLHTIDMNNLTAGGSALVEVHGVVTGLYARSTLFWQLNKGAGASATAKFVFSAAGLTPWILISNNSLTLGTNVNRGRLVVDVSAFKSDGTTAFTLIDYAGAIQGDGTFGATNVTDDVHTSMTPGTLGNLQPGEYYLHYAYGGDKIAIYFNNRPLSKGTLVTIQ